MSSDPTGRALQLLTLLQTRRRWTGAELAERLEVTERTIRRHVDRLRDLGYPVDASPGADGGYRLAAGAHLPPLVFDDDEAVAVAIGLRTAAGAAIGGIEDASLQALTKIEQLLPDHLRRRVAALHRNVVSLHWSRDDLGSVDADALAVLAAACRDGEQVRFDYRRRDGESASRLVEPHQMVTAAGRWFLVAWDLRRADWRTFRLDRLAGARLAGVRFTPREIPGGDGGAFVEASIASIPREHTALVRVSAAYDVVTVRAGWIDHERIEHGAGTCTIRVRANSADRLVTTIVRLAQVAPVRVLEPASVAGEVAALAGRLGQRGPR